MQGFFVHFDSVKYWSTTCWLRWTVCCWLAFACGLAHGQRIRMQDGRQLEGRLGMTSGVADNPEQPSGQAGAVRVTPIQIIDDELRRVFVPRYRVAEVLEAASDPLVKIRVFQNVDYSGRGVASVGPSLQVTPFDEYGRRIYTMRTKDGPLDVVQGITTLTPHYAIVEGLQGAPGSVVWDMRIATSSIPPDRLQKILARAVPQDDPRARLQIVRFYLQGEQYPQARRELEAILRKYPENRELSVQVGQLRQMGARKILGELKLRQTAGQHQLVQVLLKNFPAEEVAGETLQQVREMIAQYDRAEGRIAHIGARLQATVDQIEDAAQRKILQPLVTQMTKQLTHNNVQNLIPYVQLLDDDSLSAEQKGALAISGWLLGANGASENLVVAVSLVQVRDAVRAYLREPLPSKRSVLLDSMRSLEGATVEKVAQLLRQMAPPWAIDEKTSRGYGFYELIASGRGESGNFRYLVQLPPEYDPARRYPAVLTLCGANQTPRMSLDFWAGSQRRNQAGEVTGPRRGQAMRHGYITIAVEWLEPHQYRYDYSLREHTAVLTCLRDACRRLSIDTDRVFLSGYDMGGEAAWDMAQSHPDLWAGAIPISARSDKYDKFYWENSKYVPFYFVFGELDGKIMSHNGSLLNMYLKRRFDTTVVEYLGRGHETFHDEILHLFDWMGRKQRSGAPVEFACKTLRPWDNFFWWIECGPFPEQWMMYPEAWQKRDVNPTQISGKIPKALKQARSNRLMARTASLSTTVWLSPEQVDFDKPITVTLNGKKLTRSGHVIRPDLEVLLEDVRTRADRHHPFWAKLESP
jgi:predicted esterase